MRIPGPSGVWAIVRLDVRLERWRLAVWIVSLSLMPAVVYRSYANLLPSSVQRTSISSAFSSSTSLTVLAGPARGLSTLGGLTAWKSLMFCAVLAAMMAITTVVRRTRGDEEAGRTELLGATPLARAAGLSAGIVLGTAASALVTLLTFIGLVVIGSPPLGAAALAVAIGGTGCAFVGVAAVASQCAASARSANAIAFVVLGGAFALRAVGDTTGLGWLDWITPLGWAEQVSPYATNRVALGMAFVVLGLALCLVAGQLRARRDLGSGVFPERPGPATGGPILSSAAGLAWRLDARPLLIWVVGLTALGAVVGSVTRSLTSLADSNDLLQHFLGQGHGTVTDLYVGQMLGMLGVLAAAAGVQAVMRARGEEEAGRAEELLATGLTRARFLGSHLLLGAVGSVVLLITSGTALGITASLSGAPLSTRVLATSIVLHTVPCLVLVGAAAALVGCAPRWTVVALPLVIGTYFLTSFGDLLQLPRWVLDLSVYAHIPPTAGGGTDTASIIGLAVVAIGLGAVGLLGMRQRDLT